MMWSILFAISCSGRARIVEVGLVASDFSADEFLRLLKREKFGMVIDVWRSIDILKR